MLDAVLDLLVEGGDQLTMTAVARRASCSKETLYKWFGDRDGLLDRHRALAGVQGARRQLRPRSSSTRDALRDSLEAFAANWLTVISSRHLDRAQPRGRQPCRRRARAISARIVLANGRFAIGERLKPLLEAGRAAGLLAFDDAEDGVPHLLRAGRPRRADPPAARRPAETRPRPKSRATRRVPPTSSSRFTARQAAPKVRHSDTINQEGNVTCASITIATPISTSSRARRSPSSAMAARAARMR